MDDLASLARQAAVLIWQDNERNREFSSAFAETTILAKLEEAVAETRNRRHGQAPLMDLYEEVLEAAEEGMQLPLTKTEWWDVLSDCLSDLKETTDQLAAAQAECVTAQLALSAAALELPNVAGPVDHRIRIYKKRQRESNIAAEKLWKETLCEGYHGCLTGDCDHNTANGCLNRLRLDIDAAMAAQGESEVKS